MRAKGLPTVRQSIRAAQSPFTPSGDIGLCTGDVVDPSIPDDSPGVEFQPLNGEPSTIDPGSRLRLRSIGSDQLATWASQNLGGQVGATGEQNGLPGRHHFPRIRVLCLYLPLKLNAVAHTVGQHSNPQAASVRHQLHLGRLAQRRDFIGSGLVVGLKQKKHSDDHARRKARLATDSLTALFAVAKAVKGLAPHELAGLKYYRTASAYNWLGITMAHPTRAIQLLLEQCEPDVLSPMFEIEIDAILRQADEYAKTGQVLEREQLREMLMHLIAKAAGE